MRTPDDFNHVDGCNMLKADLSVRWYDDGGGDIMDTLYGLQDDNGEETQAFLGIWMHLDNNGKSTGGNTGDYSDDYLGWMMQYGD
jgi:hypothetical protein